MPRGSRCYRGGPERRRHHSTRAECRCHGIRTEIDTEGRNLKKWEIVLANLPRQIIGRPIYKREKDIKETINTKENPVNDAYVIAYVTEMDILKPSFRDKALVDRFGHELLRLKDNILKVENITKLVHQTGNYTYRKGLLTKL